MSDALERAVARTHIHPPARRDQSAPTTTRDLPEPAAGTGTGSGTGTVTGAATGTRTGDEARTPYRSMPDAERSALWRQRLYEAEGGLTRLVVARGGNDETLLADFFVLQAQIFADLPDARTAPPIAWQRVFFRGQALMERFLVTRYGESVLADWGQANAEVHGHVEPDFGRGAADPVHRIARQAELYGSDYELDDDAADPEHAAVTIAHCAIWDYREQARRTGVRLTLASPCTYCTESLSANIRAKGFVPAHQLRTGPTGHGCRWEVAAPARRPGPAAEPVGVRADDDSREI